MKVRLQNSVTLKDQYIRKILSLCGVYLSALEDFNRIAGRKIKAGQVVDLLNMIESGKSCATSCKISMRCSIRHS